MAPRRPRGPKVVRAGGTVTYHGTEGDRKMTVVRFGPGYADLVDDDGAEVLGVREGTDVGRWSR